MGWVTKELWFDSGRGERFLCILKCQDQLWVHIALYLVGKRGSFPHSKGPGYVADCLHASGVEVKN
jgi:hypothetical protein